MSKLFGKHVHIWRAVMLIMIVAGVVLLAATLRKPASFSNSGGGTLDAIGNDHDGVTGENQFSPTLSRELTEKHLFSVNMNFLQDSDPESIAEPLDTPVSEGMPDPAKNTGPERTAEPASSLASENTEDTVPVSFRNDRDEEDRMIDFDHPIIIEAVPVPHGQDADGQGGITFMVEPSQIIQLDPDSLEWMNEIGGEAKEPVSEILETVLSLTTGDGIVCLDFYMENISADSLDLRYGSGKKFDFTVNDNQGIEIYRWSHDKCFTTAIVDMTLEPGERLSFIEVWEFMDNHGQPVPAGDYTVTVMMCPRLKDGRTINPDELITRGTIKVE